MYQCCLLSSGELSSTFMKMRGWFSSNIQLTSHLWGVCVGGSFLFDLIALAMADMLKFHVVARVMYEALA